MKRPKYGVVVVEVRARFHTCLVFCYSSLGTVRENLQNAPTEAHATYLELKDISVII